MRFLGLCKSRQSRCRHNRRHPLIAAINPIQRASGGDHAVNTTSAMMHALRSRSTRQASNTRLFFFQITCLLPTAREIVVSPGRPFCLIFRPFLRSQTASLPGTEHSCVSIPSIRDSLLASKPSFEGCASHTPSFQTHGLRNGSLIT